MWQWMSFPRSCKGISFPCLVFPQAPFSLSSLSLSTDLPRRRQQQSRPSGSSTVGVAHTHAGSIAHNGGGRGGREGGGGIPGAPAASRACTPWHSFCFPPPTPDIRRRPTLRVPHWMHPRWQGVPTPGRHSVPHDPSHQQGSSGCVTILRGVRIWGVSCSAGTTRPIRTTVGLGGV